MNLVKRLKRECMMQPIMWVGYSRKMASIWYRKVSWDDQHHGEEFGRDVLRDIHKRGYLSRSIEKYNLLEDRSDSYITDFDYIYLEPFNNSFSKWLDDMLTTNRILKDYEKYCRRVYFTISRRRGAPLILRVGHENCFYGKGDIILLIKRLGVIELRPAHWVSKRPRYKLAFKNNTFYLDDKKSSEKTIRGILDRIQANYVATDYVDLTHSFGKGLTCQHFLKLWVANNAAETTQILEGEMNLRPHRDAEWSYLPFDLNKGSFTVDGREILLNNWAEIRRTVLNVGEAMKQLNFFSVSIALDDTGSFVFLHFGANPWLPNFPFSDALNDYLKEAARKKKEASHITLSDRIKAVKESKFNHFVAKHCRPGIRPYMQKLWLNAAFDDLLHTKGVPLSKKIWALKRGFLSFRIKQYGLTEENYKNYLSDYDYHWLNRINSTYQIWINDKTTFRYILDPFKDYIPKYYLSIVKQDGEPQMISMQDCPAGIEASFPGLCKLLEQEGRLAMKPSAGTHGDGFYSLAYSDGQYLVNGEPKTAEELYEIIRARHSFYVVTSYIEMHPALKAIYPTSVNSIRMMVINRHGYDPKIMQTYMRIGSSRTGYTDNVAYGGICSFIDIETGELYGAETLRDHEYHACPVHPDTGTEISGVIPHWKEIKKKILEICRYLSELEYLGFDVAVTEDSFQVMEINVHQDLHKVALYSDEINDFFREKIRIKKSTFRK